MKYTIIVDLWQVVIYNVSCVYKIHILKKRVDIMPSETFKNLDENKKQRLIKAAIEEFSRVSFSEASINNIINNAKISRGSFYMYFENKDNLFKYILNFHKQKFNELIKINLKKNNGDIKIAFGDMFDDIINYISKNNVDFFKNVFLNMNYMNQNYIVPRKEDYSKKNINEFSEYVNQDILNINEKVTLSDIFEILLGITIPAIIHSIIGKVPIEIIKDKYMKKLELVCYGIYRKENE